MMADLSSSWRKSQQPGSSAEVPFSSSGRGAGAERQECCFSRAGDEEQQREGAGWEGSFTAEQEPLSASRSEGGNGPQAEEGPRSNEAPNPGTDRAQAEKGRHPGGREDGEHLAMAARQHTMVSPHHPSPPLSFTTLLHNSSFGICPSEEMHDELQQ